MTNKTIATCFSCKSTDTIEYDGVNIRCTACNSFSCGNIYLLPMSIYDHAELLGIDVPTYLAVSKEAGNDIAEHVKTFNAYKTNLFKRISYVHYKTEQFEYAGAAYYHEGNDYGLYHYPVSCYTETKEVYCTTCEKQVTINTTYEEEAKAIASKGAANNA